MLQELLTQSLGFRGQRRVLPHRLQGSIVSEVLHRAITFDVQEDRAELECSVVGNPRAPVGGNPFCVRIRWITPHDRDQILDLLAAGHQFRANPAILFIEHQRLNLRSMEGELRLLRWNGCAVDRQRANTDPALFKYHDAALFQGFGDGCSLGFGIA